MRVVERGCWRRCWCSAGCGAGAGAGAVSAWWRQVAGAGAGCRCWCWRCELAVHVVETGLLVLVPGAGAGARCRCWCCAGCAHGGDRLLMLLPDAGAGAGWCWRCKLGVRVVETGCWCRCCRVPVLALVL